MRIGIAKRGGGGGGGAPTTATYIIQTANASLPSAQVLDDLAAGIIKVSAAGVLQTATAGSDYAGLAVANIFTTNGAASTPPISLTGTWFTGGSGTTTKPQLLIEPTGSTSTGWQTSGTGLGVNAPSGFTGSIFDFQLNGTSGFRMPGGSGVSLAIGGGRGLTVEGGILGSSVIQAGASNSIYWSTRSTMQSPSNGVITLGNFDANDFSRLQFGGTTSSFPALKRSTTYIQARLADDSAYTGFHAAHVTTAALTVATLPGTPIQGMRAFVTDSNAVSYTAGIGAVVAAGGATAVPVVYDGTNWRIG